MSNDQRTLQDLAVFVEVARMESYSRAGEALGLSAATASRRVGALEKDCGAKLFNRTTRRVALTEIGARFFEQCSPIVDAARQARERLREQMSHVAGPLRISMPADFGASIVGRWLPEFALTHPGVRLQLDLSPNYRDLMRENFDVVLRLGALRDKGLVCRRIAVLDQALFASPVYLKRHGSPQRPAELGAHECIFIGGGAFQTTWAMRCGASATKVAVQGRFSVNNQSLMRVLAEQGMGIALLEPTLSQPASSTGRLVRVLPEWSLPRIPVYAVTTSRLRSAVVRAFVDFLAERLKVN